MATFTLRHFSCPETLSEIAPARLLAFLEPHREFFHARDLPLPRQRSADELDCEELATIFMTPDEKTPGELINALYLVDEMATEEGMDALLAAAEKRGLKLAAGADHSSADVAVDVWLRDRGILERKHAEQYLAKVRSFEYFQMDTSKKCTFTKPSFKQCRELAKVLDNWFENKKRGRGSKVIMCVRPDGVWFLIRHGAPFKREASLDGVDLSSVCYRPLKYDVLVYAPQIRELGIHAESRAEKQLYRETFAKHLFGDKDIFPDTEKYSLEPLRKLGEDSLALGDIEGIDWIKLTEVQFFFGGDPWEVRTRKSHDIFAMLKARKQPFPTSGRIVRATFRVKFSDAKTPRSIVIKPPNVAQYTRDADSVLVERWLKLRGFIKGRTEARAQPKRVLAGH